MKKIESLVDNSVTFISVVNEIGIYKKCVLENKYIKNNNKIKTFFLDNTKENLFISKRYNQFIDSYDFSQENWFIFCHSDWEIKEDIVPRLTNLDKNCLYGPIGAIVVKNEQNVVSIECRGIIFDKMRNGSNERLMEADSFEDGVLADTFDCQCLIVHSSLIRKHNLRFDENLEFDMYVEDFCMFAKVKYGIESKILNIDCCHWQQLDDIKERPHYFDKVDYIKDKYPNSLFGTTIIPLGGNSNVEIKKIKNVSIVKLVKIKEKGRVYQWNVDISNQYDARVIAINYIKEKSKVLDVGCACGDFGSALKKVKNCDVYGMEYDVESIKIAEKSGSYSEIYQIDLNDFDKYKYTHFENKFDYIVFGDVLEHILYPQEILKKFKYFLKEDGYFIISLPNIAHASIKASLLNDNFDYTEIGLLDKTHIKFFTHKSIPEFFGNIGLKIEDLNFTPLGAWGFLENNPYENIPSSVKDLILSDPHSFVCQYVMKISKSLLGKEKTNTLNKEKIEIKKDKIPFEILNLMNASLNIGVSEKEQKIEQQRQELNFIKSSKFWKLREVYLKYKNKVIWVIFCPKKFIKKYFDF